jgi:parvulin-like peptidyl-prolyl isomerase
MKAAARITLVLVVSLLVAACGPDGGPGGAGNVAATVGGDDIQSSVVSSALDDFEKTPAFDTLAQQGSEEQARRQFEQGYLSRLIRREVLEVQATEMGVEVTSAEVSEQLDQIKAQFQGDEAAFQDALKQQGITSALLERFIRDRVLEDELRQRVSGDSAPSTQELRDYYRENIDQYRQVRVSHILVTKRALAESLARQIKAAPADRRPKLFAQLAKEHSTDGSASQGGALGWQNPSVYVGPFAVALDEMKVGEVSDVVPTQFGFHVIRLEGRRTQPLEAVRGQIAAQLGTEAQDSEWQSFIIDAYKDADIEVNPRYGELDLETQQVVNAEAKDVPGAEE